MSQQAFLKGYKERSKKLLLECAGEANKSLSADERNVVQGDLYGTGEVVEETEEFIDEKLSELQREIDGMDNDLTYAYRQAVAFEQEAIAANNYSNCYVTSREFGLMFLRADEFDAQDAARRLTKHFRDKLEIFGREKLARRITQEDLNDRDKAFLASGVVSLTGATDDHGRLIFCHHPLAMFRGDNCSSSVLTVQRVCFYVYQHAIEANETSQKKGVVCLHINMGNNMFFRPSAITKFNPVTRMVHRALPLRITAAHLCYDSLIEHFIFSVGLMIAPTKHKARLQCHYEKVPKDCIEAVRAYGIDPSSLPFTEDGEFRHDLFDSYLQRQRQLSAGINNEKAEDAENLG